MIMDSDLRNLALSLLGYNNRQTLEQIAFRLEVQPVTARRWLARVGKLHDFGLVTVSEKGQPAEYFTRVKDN